MSNEHIIGCNISELIDYQDQDNDHLGICAECNHGKEEAVKVGEQVFLDQRDRPEVGDQPHWDGCVDHLDESEIR